MACVTVFLRYLEHGDFKCIIFFFSCTESAVKKKKKSKQFALIINDAVCNFKSNELANA